MRRSFGGKIVLCLAMVMMLVACVPVCQARSAPRADKQAQKAQKHAQKMQKKLSKYKPGTLLHLEFNDNTECSGKLMTISETSFTVNNTETNVVETRNYSDLTLVEKGKQYIGKGSTPKKRGRLF
jgi:hypothetical protein